MSDFAPAHPHGDIDEVFDGVFFVTGTMHAEFFGAKWQFSRNMIIVREDDRLSLINAVRLDDQRLATLEGLGTVTHVVRLGSMHGLDDAFYLDRYDATYWAMPNMTGDGPKVDRELGEALPFEGSLFSFETTKVPEGILRLDREGGIMIACDAMQNWAEPDEYFSDDTVGKMTEMGFFTPANVGPGWMQGTEPKPEDFARLKEIEFRHALCGHGAPLRDGAREAFHATFARLFDV